MTCEKEKEKENIKTEYIEKDKKTERDVQEGPDAAVIDTHLYVEFERDGQRIPIRELQLDLYYKEGSTYRKIHNPSTTSIAGYSLNSKRPCRINFYFPGPIGASPHEVESSCIYIAIDGGVRNSLEMYFDKRFPELVRELVTLNGRDTIWQDSILENYPVILQIEKDGSFTHKK